MFRNIFRLLLFVLAYLLLPIGVFYLGYRLTDNYFIIKEIPLPFEPFGVAVGSALFLWTLALAQTVMSRIKLK